MVQKITLGRTFSFLAILFLEIATILELCLAIGIIGGYRPSQTDNTYGENKNQKKKKEKKKFSC